jgi:hypothetical protein
MPNVECPLCQPLAQTTAAGAQPLRCPACGAARKSPFDGLPVWPGTLSAMLPGARRNMMADDDDDDDGDDDEEKVSEKPMARKKGKGRDDDEDDDDGDEPKKKKKAGMGIGMILGIVAVLLVCCICTPVGVGVGLMFMGIGNVQGAAARTQSINNLKQIGLAFQSFHDANKRLPFNGSNQAVGNVKYSATAIAGNPTSGSWAFQILPYMEEIQMYNAIDKTRGIKTDMCPGRSRPQVEAGGGAWTDYFINGYVNDPNQASKPDAPDNKRTLIGISDGTSNTIIVGHGNITLADYTKNANVAGSTNIFVGGTVGTLRSGNNGATNPGGVTLSKDSAAAPGIGSWGGPFPQGALMAMGDGTVRMFPYTTPNFSAFLTPTGNENTILPD